MQIKRAAFMLLAGLVIAASAIGCDDDPTAYVTGEYNCINPNSGMLDYCLYFSDGTSQLVPYSVYSHVYYGSTITYVHNHYSYSTPRVRRYAPDVYHVTYHPRTGGSTTSSSYGGMSYKTKTGRVIYRSSSSSYRSSSSSFHSSYSGRH